MLEIINRKNKLLSKKSKNIGLFKTRLICWVVFKKKRFLISFNNKINKK